MKRTAFLYSAALSMLLFITGCATTKSTRQNTKVSLTEGLWSFDIQNNNASITYYAGKTDSTVIVPSVLGGRTVTSIASQAFGHHGEILEVYVPSTVTTVSDWAFYDLNGAMVISFANPDVQIAEGAFQSSANAVLYLPSGTAQKTAGGKTAVSEHTEPVSVTLVHEQKASIAGSTYLAVNGKPDAAAIAAIAKSYNGTAAVSGSTVTFTGDDYLIQIKQNTIAAALKKKVSLNDLNKTFRSLTAEQAQTLNTQIASDPSYSKVKSLLTYEAGYYLNGNRITLSDSAKAYDVQTGRAVGKNSDGLFPSTGTAYNGITYLYADAQDTDDNGIYDIVYYSPYDIPYTYDSVNIKSSNTSLNGLSARTVLNPVYQSFANAVVEAHNGKNIHVKKLAVSTSSSGKTAERKVNQERSLLWAEGYGSITAGQVNGVSSSVSNWAKMSHEAGLDAYNVEITMEWGMNALLYATNGGQIQVGTKDGPRSVFTGFGDGANGIIAGGTGKNAASDKAAYSTAAVTVTNADFNLTGWNNHIADVVYGGYASLTDVAGKTGIKGSYAVGQGSALANDFGNGVIDADNFHTEVYGNRSAGAYVIGGGIINANNSSFTSYADSGLVIASGGTYKIRNSSAAGLIGLRNRGGITENAVSTFDAVSFTADMSHNSSYVTGSTALQAAEAWKKASGTAELIHYMASDPNMTLGTLCKNYTITPAAKQELYSTLGTLAGKTYTDSTPFRLSVLDNTYYNYSAGAYTGTTDFSDVPYLTIGSSFGGLVSSVFEFEASGVNLNLNNCAYKNTNTADYDYLAASEAGSAPVINFNGGSADGIIFNEGTVFRFVEGRPDSRSSKITVHFNNAVFNGSFADGSNGLWNVTGLSYTDGSGKTVSRNGNYYNGLANWGITASFDKTSVWTVTHDSYLGNLTIADGAQIKAPEGYSLVMTVDGKETPVTAGTYTGQIILKVIKK